MYLCLTGLSFGDTRIKDVINRIQSFFSCTCFGRLLTIIIIMMLALKSGPQIAVKTGNPAGLLCRQIWYSVWKSGVLGITECRQGRPLHCYNIRIIGGKNYTFQKQVMILLKQIYNKFLWTVSGIMTCIKKYFFPTLICSAHSTTATFGSVTQLFTAPLKLCLWEKKLTTKYLDFPTSSGHTYTAVGLTVKSRCSMSLMINTRSYEYSWSRNIITMVLLMVLYFFLICLLD